MNVSLVTLYQCCSSCHDSSKNRVSSGWGLFSLYIYIKNLKKSSCKKQLDWVQCNLAGMLLWWPSTKIVQAFMIGQKHGPWWGGAYFPYVYLYRKLWNSSCQIPPDRFQCCFGDPQPWMFKQSWFVKKHGCLGVGLIFPIYLGRKLWKSSCQKPLNRFQFNLAGMFVWWPSTKFFQAVMILQKKKGR